MILTLSRATSPDSKSADREFHRISVSRLSRNWYNKIEKIYKLELKSG